jgi:hypothetical protein
MNLSELPMFNAACLCGSLRARVAGVPARVSVCHCAACQRRTGSAFGAQAKWPSEMVTLAGPRTTYERTCDSGGTVTSSFCSQCGTTVAWEVSGMPGFTVVALGCFTTDSDSEAWVNEGEVTRSNADDDTTVSATESASSCFPEPTFSVYESRALPWALRGIPADAEHWD